jgi:hypothetical protein
MGVGVAVGGIDFGHVGEEGEGGIGAVPGAVVGKDFFAALEDFAIALVAGFVLVDFHPPHEGAGVVEKMKVESVLRLGVGELGDFFQGRGVAALEGEGVEFFFGEAFFGREFFEPVVVGFGLVDDGLGDGGVEALAEVGEAEDVFELPRSGWSFGVVEVAGGGGGRGGDVEVGLEADAELDGVEGGAESRAAEPAAEDGGGGPILSGWAGGVFDEGA